MREEYTGKSAYRIVKSKTSGEFIRFPDRTSYIGKLINDYLANTKDTANVSDQTIHFYLVLIVGRLRRVLKRTYVRNNTCLRSLFTAVCRLSAKGTPAWILNGKMCDRGLPSPDCVIYLDMPWRTAKRGQFGGKV